MSDRHLHCVYFQYNDENSIDGFCLLKQEKIEDGMRHHCDKIVLRPYYILSYFLIHNHYCEDWECTDRKAIEYLNRTGFNNYPKKS